MEIVLEKNIGRAMTVDELQCDFMPWRGRIDAVLIRRRLQEEYHVRGKCCMCVLRT